MSAMTQSLEDYLEAVYMLIAEDRPAQVRDVAKMLSVKMPSVVKAIRELKKLELVTQEPYAAIELTDLLCHNGTGGFRHSATEQHLADEG